MSMLPFTYTSNNALLAQPDGSGQSLVFRSSNAADTMNLKIHGNVAAAYANETNALTGQREGKTTALFQTLLHAQLASAAAGTVTVLAPGVAAAGFIFVGTNPANDVAITVGLTGFTRVYTWKTVLTGAANEIFIGATAEDSAINLKKAINDEGTAGTHYGTGTTINEYLTATISGQNVTITDKVPCDRQLVWVLSQSSTEFSLQAPSGGADGTELASLTAGVTTAADNITLDNEDLADANLLAGMSFESDWITCNGEAVTLYLNASSTPNLTFSYKTQLAAGGTVYSGQTTISGIGSGTVSIVNPTENAIQRIQLRIDNSAGTAARNVSAHVVF